MAFENLLFVSETDLGSVISVNSENGVSKACNDDISIKRYCHTSAVTKGHYPHGY